MKSWTKEIVIDAPIEVVWALFDGSTENMQKIMPQVVDNEPIKVTEEKVGSIYLQTYQEGKRKEQYEVETLIYVNHPDHKHMKVGFTLANLFDITAEYECWKQGEHQTLLRYTATNRPLKWFVRLFLIFAREKVVIDFIQRVKIVAEQEAVHTSTPPAN
ncbi:SRPBCC family protein [Marinicrinis sediminis]|uniref:SRPBCC family protein n=1 Tax=Marinicrinis sediminis TaxID=1652465 RepID=A0ABW5RE82_9BACL